MIHRKIEIELFKKQVGTKLNEITGNEIPIWSEWSDDFSQYHWQDITVETKKTFTQFTDKGKLSKQDPNYSAKLAPFAEAKLASQLKIEEDTQKDIVKGIALAKIINEADFNQPLTCIKEKTSHSKWYENEGQEHQPSIYKTMVPKSVKKEALELQRLRKKHKGNTSFDFVKTSYKTVTVREADHDNFSGDSFEHVDYNVNPNHLDELPPQLLDYYQELTNQQKFAEWLVREPVGEKIDRVRLYNGLQKCASNLGYRLLVAKDEGKMNEAETKIDEDNQTILVNPKIKNGSNEQLISIINALAAAAINKSGDNQNSTEAKIVGFQVAREVGLRPKADIEIWSKKVDQIDKNKIEKVKSGIIKTINSKVNSRRTVSINSQVIKRRMPRR